jgi:HD-GYP domain-containing protein (c-di-GMP phosphodiesterase class II)
MTATVAGQDASRSIERMGFLPVAVDTLTASVELPFDLFLRVDPEAPPILYRGQHLTLEPGDFDRLGDQGVNTLYIRVDDHATYLRFLRETVLGNEDVPAAKKFRILQIANRAVFQMAFNSRKVDRLVNFAGEYGEELANLVCDDSLAASELLNLMAHDYYTYTHATNVSVLTLLIANQIGMGLADGIVALATGAVLHDIGKRQIAPALLNQRTPLTQSQRQTIREHSALGFAELADRQDLLWDQLMMVYQHHERWDGRGYPVGLVGDEIHPWARICAVADVYDAMASSRPYRAALPLERVWEVLEGGSDKEFDREYVAALQSAVTL